jgi:hypothetical protein
MVWWRGGVGVAVRRFFEKPSGGGAASWTACRLSRDESCELARTKPR